MSRITKYSPLVLLILDGWGYTKQLVGNAILQSKTPNLDAILQKYPFTLLQASGLTIGMDWGEAGNSEIGHLTIGAGRQVEQYSLRINNAIKNGGFFNIPALTSAFDHAIQNNSNIHLVGLLTSGSVHADFEHILALIQMAEQKLPINNSAKVSLHLFLDGRDSGQHEGVELLAKLQEEIGQKTNIKITTTIGRNFAMDRDNNWDHTKIAYELLTRASGKKVENADIIPTIKSYYDNNLTDSDIPPTTISDYQGIKTGDSLIFFNFREDSMRQLIRSFIDPDEQFTFFPRTVPGNIYVASMTQYIEDPELHFAFEPPKIQNALTEILSDLGFSQLHIAETEKYAHVTYFFNGITNRQYKGEVDIFIKSDKDPVKQPEMETGQITQKVIEEIDRNFYEFILINFANGDILAHEGNLESAKKGVEYVDSMIGRLQEKISEHDGILIITADHGNVESMTYKGSGETETKHETSPVPFHLVGKEYITFKDEQEIKKEEQSISGILADVAPTILAIMGIKKPAEMTGESLLGKLMRG